MPCLSTRAAARACTRLPEELAIGRRPQRRKLAVSTWTASTDGRIFARIELPAAPIVQYAESLSANGTRVTSTHVVGRSLALGLQRIPAFNSRVLHGRVVPRTRIDVGFAVDISAGADLAPMVVRDADRCTTVEIARMVREGVSTVRNGKDRNFARSNGWVRIAPWPLLPAVTRFVGYWSGGLGRRSFGQPGHPLGSVFISNVGSLGLDEGWLTPIPFARVPLYIGIGAIRDAAMVEDDRVVVRPRMVLTATADHRVVDGAHAAQLARWLRESLADPAAMDP